MFRVKLAGRVNRWFMKERINQLANGLVEYDLPKPRLSLTTIEESIQEGLPFKGEFLVTSDNDAFLKGLVYSSNYRVHIVNYAFGGKKSKIQYEVDTCHLYPGAKAEGSFHLVTNGGEIELPYCFYQDSAVNKASLKELVTLQDFADYAMVSPDGALRLFEYSGFVNAPFMQDLTIRALYDSLYGKGERYHTLEEFLIGSAVKDPIEISIDKTDWKIGRAHV